MTDTLKPGIVTAINADATLTALIGTRIYPDRASEKEPLPYVTFHIVIETGVHHQLNVSKYALTQMQFSVWATSSVERQAIKDALRALFDGKVRQTFGTSFNASVRNTNNLDTVEDPIDGSQNFTFGTFMDFEFWHIR